MFGFGGTSSSTSFSGGGGLSFGEGVSKPSSSRSPSGGGGLSFGSSVTSSSSSSSSAYGGPGGYSLGTSVPSSGSSSSFGSSGGIERGTSASGSGGRTSGASSGGFASEGTSFGGGANRSQAPSRSDDADDDGGYVRGSSNRGASWGGLSLSGSGPSSPRSGATEVTLAQATVDAPSRSSLGYTAPSFGYLAGSGGWQPTTDREDDPEPEAAPEDPGGFLSGFRDGVRGGLVGARDGIAAVGRFGYDMATDAEVRAETAEAISDGWDATRDYAGEAVRDPGMVVGDVRDAAVDGYGRADTFVRTADAEDWGNLAGGLALDGAAALVTAGAAAAAVRAARVAGAVDRAVPDVPPAVVPDLHRPYIRNSVREEVEARAPRTADGRFIDPNTRMPIDGPHHLGHTSGNEFWRERRRAMEEGLTQSEFNDRMNNADLYEIEDPKSNMSHEFEDKRPYVPGN